MEAMPPTKYAWSLGGRSLFQVGIVLISTLFMVFLGLNHWSWIRYVTGKDALISYIDVASQEISSGHLLFEVSATTNSKAPLNEITRHLNKAKEAIASAKYRQIMHSGRESVPVPYSESPENIDSLLTLVTSMLNRTDDSQRDGFQNARELANDKILVDKFGEALSGINSLRISVQKTMGEKLIEHEKTFFAHFVLGIFVFIAWSVALLHNERKRAVAEEGLREAKEEAETATKLKDTFVALVAHDLRSPIASITSLLNLIRTKDEGRLSEKQKSVFGHMIQNSNNLLRMIDKLLDINRLQAGRISLEPELIDVRLLASAAIDSVSFLAREKGIEIVNNVNNDAMLLADPTLFHEVIHNLISNAIKFCEEGDRITISTPSNQPGTVAVRDTGPGIGKDILPDVFKHTVATSTRGTQGERGSGLGLPYCHEIMKAHGGHIYAESEKGKGCAMYIKLPAKLPVDNR